MERLRAGALAAGLPQRDGAHADPGARALLVAVDAGGSEIVGALLGSFDGRVATVSRLATHPGHRRRGVASALMDDFSRTLADLGADDALLLVLDRNPTADLFWAAIDYTHAADVRAYRRGSPDR